MTPAASPTRRLPLPRVGATRQPDQGGHVSSARFRWKWVLLAIPALLTLQVAGAIGLALAGQWDPIVVVPMTLVSFFVGGLLIAYCSPGITIREPAVGIAIAVVLTNLVLGRTEGSGLVISWIVPALLGLAGAGLGERMQASRRRSHEQNR
jgi:hypothetical protein